MEGARGRRPRCRSTRAGGESRGEQRGGREKSARLTVVPLLQLPPSRRAPPARLARPASSRPSTSSRSAAPGTSTPSSSRTPTRPTSSANRFPRVRPALLLFRPLLDRRADTLAFSPQGPGRRCRGQEGQEVKALKPRQGEGCEGEVVWNGGRLCQFLCPTRARQLCSTTTLTRAVFVGGERRRLSPRAFVFAAAVSAGRLCRVLGCSPPFRLHFVF